MPDLIVNGEVIEPESRTRPDAISVEAMDLPEGHFVDKGEKRNPNWGSGIGHTFTVTNETDQPVTIVDIKVSSEAMRSVNLGDQPEARVPGRPRSRRMGIFGKGTVLQPDESTTMQVSMQVGAGLWRHGVTLITDSGEEWHYQLAMTGVIDPQIQVSVRRAPNTNTPRRLDLVTYLVTGVMEDAPMSIVEPEGVELVFDQWARLPRSIFFGGNPYRQLGFFTLDFTNYRGDYPCSVKLRTALGAEAYYYCYGFYD